MIKIVVKTENLGGELDWGFADIEDVSSHPIEKEILFNPINIFKVHRCRKEQTYGELNVDYVIELEYGAQAELKRKKEN